MPKLALIFFSRSSGSADTQPRSLLASCRACSIFVSSVAGYNVGAPAIGLQNLSHALQNKIAFKVPVEIVYKFEAVEVHEHQRKGAAGSGRTLPFRG